MSKTFKYNPFSSSDRRDRQCELRQRRAQRKLKREQPIEHLPEGERVMLMMDLRGSY